MRFLGVKTDFAFKKVFGSVRSVDIFIDFLNALQESRLVLTIVKPYQMPMSKHCSLNCLDTRV